jgi:hypothetical protein
VSPEGQPLPRSLVRAVPVGTSATPLPVTTETLGQAALAGGDAAFADEAGRVTLRLMRGHRHLIVVAPMPFGLMPLDEDAAGGALVDGAPVWNWRLDDDLRTLTPWHSEAAGTAAAAATRAGPALRVH